jgi:hypothetical protein
MTADEDGAVATLTDAIVLAQFQQVLSNWQYTRYVTASDTASEWMVNELAGVALRDLAKALFQFVQSGGIIDQQLEKRPEWNIWPFHYDFRLHLAGRFLYIETILRDDDPKDPTIHIVSIHDV